jgi:hypothetical protein
VMRQLYALGYSIKVEPRFYKIASIFHPCENNIEKY